MANLNLDEFDDCQLRELMKMLDERRDENPIAAVQAMVLIEQELRRRGAEAKE